MKDGIHIMWCMVYEYLQDDIIYVDNRSYIFFVIKMLLFIVFRIINYKKGLIKYSRSSR